MSQEKENQFQIEFVSVSTDKVSAMVEMVT